MDQVENEIKTQFLTQFTGPDDNRNHILVAKTKLGRKLEDECPYWPNRTLFVSVENDRISAQD